jgi:hypothetical protein
MQSSEENKILPGRGLFMCKGPEVSQMFSLQYFLHRWCCSRVEHGCVSHTQNGHLIDEVVNAVRKDHEDTESQGRGKI